MNAPKKVRGTTVEKDCYSKVALNIVIIKGYQTDSSKAYHQEIVNDHMVMICRH